MSTDVGAVSAVATADPTADAAQLAATRALVAAQSFSNVNLAEMIANRLNGTAVSMTLGAGGSVQVGGILKAASRSSDASSSLDVPEALRAYGNGRIPREMLTPIGIGQHRLWSVAAGAFTQMRSAAAAEGVDIGVTDSYRTYDQQVDLAERKGLWKNGGYAAVPGTSPHGWGLALDVDVDPAGLNWLRANAGRFGFVETTPREPWHWEFRGAT